MPRLNDQTVTFLRAGAEARDHIRQAWDGFINFAARDNVLEVALGLIIAQAFTKVVTSFVSDIILPVISLLPFLSRNMDEKFAVLTQGPNYADMNGYNTLEQAREDGALVLAYGVFLQTILSFFGVSLTLYAIAHIYTWISDDRVIKPTVRCRYCKKFISDQATRCVNCSSWQDGREDRTGWQ
ncbi:MscL family protein [Aspergillus candidus]|uniref:Putative ion channel n=1 Tax=Aspergillus candidus TaxID=41067 RepID=A0A2I2FAV7_ASPCN|nr:putative ion channel [Aspergillus candidus]PLB37743.1 putative ion channel [Aspergillus candidus]